MINKLMNFLDKSRTAFNATSNLKALLVKEGYEELKENAEFNILRGGQ